MFGRKRGEMVCFCTDKISIILEENMSVKNADIFVLKTLYGQKWTFFWGSRVVIIG